MDSWSLAAAAVGLLVGYFKQVGGKVTERAAEAMADAAVPKLKALYERIRGRFAPDTYEGALLKGFEEQPEDADRQQGLEAALAKSAQQEPEFAADLQRLVAEAETAGGLHITASEGGVVAGRDVHLRGRYVAGRDMSVGGATPSNTHG
jgi:hypothetical protein